MHRIQPYQIWIGHAGDGRDLRNLLDHGIHAVVQLAFEEPPVNLQREIIVERYPLLDGTANSPKLLRLAIHGVVALIQERVPVLICCGAGMSRSPAIVAAAISIIDGRELQECLKIITEHSPADISPGLWQDVVDLCGKMRDHRE